MLAACWQPVFCGLLSSCRAQLCFVVCLGFCQATHVFWPALCAQEAVSAYLGKRASAWEQVQAACSALQPSAAGLPYTAMLLLDQAATAGLLNTGAAAGSPSAGLQPAWIAAALVLASTPISNTSTPGLSAGVFPAGTAGGAAVAAALPEAAVAGHFDVSTEALQAAVVTLRDTCVMACTTPVNPQMMLDLFLQVLSAGRMEYQVCLADVRGPVSPAPAQRVLTPFWACNCLYARLYCYCHSVVCSYG